MLVELSDVPTDDYREVYVWRHPWLLEPGVAENLAARIAASAPAGRSSLSAALDYVYDVRCRYEEHPAGYPIGVGPIEAVWQQVGTGKISQQEGERLVSAPAFTAALSNRYLRSLSAWLVDQARRGSWRPALQAVRLARTAAMASDAAIAPPELLAWIAVDWVEVAKMALYSAPDGALLTEARTVGESALADLGPGGDHRLRSALLFGLGVLFLDPYFTDTATQHVQERLTAWQRRAMLEPDQAEDEAGPGMPEPLAAMHIAESYLRQALDLRPAGARAPIMKALAEVLIWRRELGDDVAVSEITGLCQDALTDLAEPGDLRLRVSVLNILNYFGEPVDVGAATPVLERSAESLAEEFGVEMAGTLMLTAVRVVLPSAPRMALEGLKRGRRLFAAGGDGLRYTALESELTALADTLTPELPVRESLQASIEEMTQRADMESWNGAARAAAMLRLAARSSQTDEEALGLQLLDRIPETSVIVAAEHRELVAWLRTILQLNMGVNAYGDRRWADCAEWYARALTGWMDLGFDDRALEALLRVGDIARQADTPIDAEFLMALAPNAARIETRLGDGATQVIQDMVKQAVLSMSGRRANPEGLHLLWQIAKGARLAPVLASRSTYDAAGDDYGRRMLVEIDELRAGLSVTQGAADADPEVLLDEELVLSAYARRREAEGGAAPQEQLVNLEHAYDEHVTRQMLVATGAPAAAFMTLEDTQARLGSRTVLLSMYLGAAADGRIAIYVLFMTSDDVGITVIPHDFPSSTFDVGGLRTSPFGLLVEQARRGVQDPPLGRRLVTRDAEETLETYLPGLLGHVSERLQELKAQGRDHLCIVPHGPFHFFPFHLLGPPGHPLAEDFAVTYLPQLQLLAADRHQAANQQAGTAIGLGFAADSRPGLDPLPEAVSEAREIAGLFGSPPVIEEQATEGAAVAAFQSSRVVHLATHGRHNVDAPTFQMLYLHPAADSDGMLHAYELLGLDLRGLRLLTLSACETALGRFDLGDNIRGLPASFFIAGVTTLIGTLWRVRDRVSRCFFADFYRSYLAGTPLLDAFVAAQRATRTQFPQYRDWGAFYFAGDWNEHQDSQGEGQ
jgi:hypothetical protein